MSSKLKIYKGSCHCGDIQFEIEAPAVVDVYNCNCSMCVRSGYLHLEVPASRFRLLSGEESLTTYTFNTGVAKHTFCRTCGIKSFYVPRSYPEGYSVNVNCLDKSSFEKINIIPFDGENWEQAKQDTHKPPAE